MLTTPSIGRRLGRARPATTIHNAGLDGMRGLAIVAVLLIHVRPDVFTGGFVGVDVFFVLSGYLITSLLLDEHDRSGTVWFAGFYGRRALRLLPVLAAMVAVVAVLHAFVLHTMEPDTLVYYLTPALSVQNWVVVAGHFVPDMNALWSLGVEEQLYLLWPLLLVVALRRLPDRRILLLGTVLLAALSYTLQVWFVHDVGDYFRAYHGTDTRAHALLLGAAYAIYRTLPGRPHLTARARGAVLSAAGIFVASLPIIVMRGTAEGAVAGQNALFDLGSLALVVVCVELPEVGLSRLTSTRALTMLGEISYSIYVWHMLVFNSVARALGGGPGWIEIPLALALTIAAAVLSFRLIEQPARAHRHRFDWRARLDAQPVTAPVP